MSADPIRRIADAVLYEGYVLWPYRRSALKNHQRFTFGGVFPQGWAEDPSELAVDCLIESQGDPEIETGVRFLQVVRRQALDAGGDPVDELTVGDERYLTWQEATEREVPLALTGTGEAEVPIGVNAGSDTEEIPSGSGAEPAGYVRRSWEELRGVLTVSCERLQPDLLRARVRIANGTEWNGTDRESTLPSAFCSTHCVLRVEGGNFVSSIDPPPRWRDTAEISHGEGLWPVLVGEHGDRSTMLAAPIILEDYPRIAPESPGDLFDGGEIDQLLTLNILALTDSEKAEMRDSDPRAREILERTESLSDDELMRLNGTIRDFGPAQ